jgi:hypothetical protein
MSSKTPKELAEATALAALESLQAALKDETTLRDQLRLARGHSAFASSQAERAVWEAQKRSDAAFAAWRAAQDAV